MVANPFKKASFAGGFPWHRGCPLTSQEVAIFLWIWFSFGGDDMSNENMFGDYIVVGTCRKKWCNKLSLNFKIWDHPSRISCIEWMFFLKMYDLEDYQSSLYFMVQNGYPSRMVPKNRGGLSFFAATNKPGGWSPLFLAPALGGSSQVVVSNPHLQTIKRPLGRGITPGIGDLS